MFSDFLFELVVETRPGVRTTILPEHRLQGATQSMFQTIRNRQVSRFIVMAEREEYLCWSKVGFGAEEAIFEVGRSVVASPNTGLYVG